MKSKDKKKLNEEVTDKKVNDEKCDCSEKCECHKEEKCDCSDEVISCECDCNCESDAINDDLIEELNKKIKSLEEAFLREKAEVANYKRRKDEEINKVLKYKNEDILKEFLLIIDNLERAVKMDDNDLSDEVSKFLEGFKIIYSNTLNLLNKFEVKEIEASGLEFDPTYHHAVLTEHDKNKPEGVVLEVLQKGYMYKDKVIRPAMVKVNE